MSRPIVLIHGYSAEGTDFEPLCQALAKEGINAINLNICTYISLNNDITIKDIAEGLDRAFRTHPVLKDDSVEFDAIVHSTGMLVIRSWMTNYGAAVENNNRLKRLKHLVGLAPATWGSPQAHKGRTWLGALVKGNKQPGPDFLNAGDEVLDGLELGSQFTWDLAHEDLLGPAPYYDKGPGTPYICVFIGNMPYDGVTSVANDPGTDGTVRWAGCGLNTRKITIDLTRTPTGEDGHPISRVSISPWADNRLDIPMIAVDGKNHATLIREPDGEMVKLIASFLKVGEETDQQKNMLSYTDWLAGAKEYGKQGMGKMLVNPGKGAAGLEGEAKTFFGHLFDSAEQLMEGWQQFVVHAKDERGDPVTDYMAEVLVQQDGAWKPFTDMYTDVHPYMADPSFRCFHVRLPNGISSSSTLLRARINASTGTELMVYQGYGSNDNSKELKANNEPIEIDLSPDLGNGNGTLFHPFTTTLIEIVLNREPYPLNIESRILQFLKPRTPEPVSVSATT
jgi:pimeloyl-ACP methyl ester carboxylesterase